MTKTDEPPTPFWFHVRQWFDSDTEDPTAAGRPGIAWIRAIPFLALHAACLLVLVVGLSPIALLAAGLLYVFRMLAITGFYHRYFSHHAFATSRVVQFLFALAGNSAAQRGPIWWAGHHRHHHQVADTAADLHSPSQQGFWRSHVGWLLTHDNFRTRSERTGDWNRFPELRVLNRFDTVVPALLALGLFRLGEWLRRTRPTLGTSGWQMVVWGFCLSTVALFHGTATINSLSHLYGTRRYDTPDTSRNNPWLSLVTLGEGWHNNHHHYATSARHGFFPGEFDPTWWLLRLLERAGLIWGLRPVPEKVLAEGKDHP